MRARPLVGWILGLSLFASGPLAYAAEPDWTWVEDQELMDELGSAPAKTVERVERLKELYELAGAKADEIELQEVKSPFGNGETSHNVIVTLAGKSGRTIVVGGHLDKVAPGKGIIDDWSGACLATNLYQTLRPLAEEGKLRHSFVFVGFTAEEQGLIGSREFVKSRVQQKKPGDESREYVAMLNLECLGVADPMIWTNGSTDSLERIAHKVAAEFEIPLSDHEIRGVGADSIPFEDAGVPNLTFDGLPIDKFRFIHSEEDKFENIRQEYYVNSYRLAARFLVALDAELGQPEKP